LVFFLIAISFVCSFFLDSGIVEEEVCGAKVKKQQKKGKKEKEGVFVAIQLAKKKEKKRKRLKKSCERGRFGV